MSVGLVKCRLQRTRVRNAPAAAVLRQLTPSPRELADVSTAVATPGGVEVAMETFRESPAQPNASANGPEYS